jgi:hypothetical protein
MRRPSNSLGGNGQKPTSPRQPGQRVCVRGWKGVGQKGLEPNCTYTISILGRTPVDRCCAIHFCARWPRTGAILITRSSTQFGTRPLFTKSFGTLGIVIANFRTRVACVPPVCAKSTVHAATVKRERSATEAKQPAETKLNAAEQELTAAETKLTEAKQELTAAETKLMAAETKLTVAKQELQARAHGG